MDRFFKGFFAGVGGGLILNLWGFMVKDLLHYSTRNYVDWTSVIIYGSLPTTWYESVLSFLSHLLWAGFLGVIFAYLLPKLTFYGYLFKGALYGFMLGFTIYGSAILLRMPFFTMIPFPTSVGNAVGGLLWGILTAKLLHWLDTKDKNPT